MGIGGINIWQLLIILVIVLLLFGTKRLRGLGGDLGGAIKGFKKAIKDDAPDNTAPDYNAEAKSQSQQKVNADAEAPSEATDAHKSKTETHQ